MYRMRLIFALPLAALFATAVLYLGQPPGSALAKPKDTSTLAPLDDHSETAIKIVRQLRQGHYRRTKVNDDFSSRVFDQYFSDLDATRSYFLASDIREFEKHRFTLDDALKSGDLETAFLIFNRYQRRLNERLTFLRDQIKLGLDKLDFTLEESLDTDRADAPWPTTTAEMNELWRKRLKNNVLNLKFAGKSIDDIETTLDRRYRNQQLRASQVDAEDAFGTFINAFTRTYDPHTQYFTPRRSENFNINLSLSLEGIGAVLQSESERIKVVRLVPAGPADKSKLIRPTDYIVGVGQGDDGDIVDVIGWRLDDVVRLIRGPKHTVVRLEIVRGDAENEQATRVVSITRDTVTLEEQSAQKDVIEVTQDGQTYKIGVLTIPTFYVDFKGMQAGDRNYKSTTRDVEKLLRELLNEAVDAVVVDLRNNGGGSLQEVNSLVGLFIETGPTVQIRNANGAVEVLQDPDPRLVYDGPLAVMVNRLSASASEIFAGAIQDYQRGIVIGGQTFGKGTVQSLRSLNGGQLKLTQAKFYRISGASTQSEGVLPDINYPAAFNVRKVGENVLPNALPWDNIRQASFRNYYDLDPVMEQLRRRHHGRTENNPEFEYLTQRLAYQLKLRADTTVSLNEDTRRSERKMLDEWRLSFENKHREVRGLAPVTKVDDLDEAEADLAGETTENEKDAAPDALIIESANILVDFISLRGPIVVTN